MKGFDSESLASRPMGQYFRRRCRSRQRVRRKIRCASHGIERWWRSRAVEQATERRTSGSDAQPHSNFTYTSANPRTRTTDE